SADEDHRDPPFRGRFRTGRPDPEKDRVGAEEYRPGDEREGQDDPEVPARPLDRVDDLQPGHGRAAEVEEARDKDQPPREVRPRPAPSPSEDEQREPAEHHDD